MCVDVCVYVVYLHVVIIVFAKFPFLPPMCLVVM